MPGPVDLPLTISQLANVQKISNSEISKSELQQILVINPAEQEHNKDSQKQIQKIDKDEGSHQIKDDEQKNTKQEARSRKRKEKEEESKSEEEPKSSPWSGNIINVKI
ncbi:hypothetical protein [Maridesulfovibrio frigidus]|uniref:hypothetical protein n=1 Tax=Maridesulfovibrio frigidus TaxID=340956 RepID=UPI0004E1C68F|nr:hypothetical protein [Maridesulfovibrio frigidus]